MDMTYTREQFGQLSEKRPDGTWWQPGVTEQMQRWAIKVSSYNGHRDQEIIVDNRLERALYCPHCGMWASISSQSDDFGIFGSAVYKKCEERP